VTWPIDFMVFARTATREESGAHTTPSEFIVSIGENSARISPVATSQICS
jgi:hypothetical protein